MNRIFQRVFFWAPVIILIIIIAVIISIIAMTTTALPPPHQFYRRQRTLPLGKLVFYLLITAQACQVGILPFHGPNKPTYPPKDDL